MRINPKFSHRLSQNKTEFTVTDLTDTLLLMTGRAAAILEMMALSYSEDTAHLSSDVKETVLYAAINEISDMEAVIKAFSQ